MIQKCTTCGKQFENHRKGIMKNGPGSRCDQCLIPPIVAEQLSGTFGDLAETIRRMVETETELEAFLRGVRKKEN